jgi:hypothetical protein
MDAILCLLAGAAFGAIAGVFLIAMTTSGDE